MAMGAAICGCRCITTAQSAVTYALAECRAPAVRWRVRSSLAAWMVRVLRAFAVLVAAAGAAASEKSEGGQPSNSQLAELQDQLQHAIDQQGQLSDQQAALTDALAPLLTWANNIAPQNTGCDLDHYTSIISLCGAEGSEKADLDAQGEATVSETDSGCECMDTWYYDGTRYTGCQVTEPPPGSKMHFPPWCVVSGGCTNAHPGPWGAWGHCTHC